MSVEGCIWHIMPFNPDYASMPIRLLRVTEGFGASLLLSIVIAEANWGAGCLSVPLLIGFATGITQWHSWMKD